MTNQFCLNEIGQPIAEVVYTPTSRKKKFILKLIKKYGLKILEKTGKKIVYELPLKI